MNCMLSSAKASRCGVSIRVEPVQPRSCRPRSSAKIRRTFGGDSAPTHNAKEMQHHRSVRESPRQDDSYSDPVVLASARLYWRGNHDTPPHFLTEKPDRRTAVSGPATLPRRRAKHPLPNDQAA